jgi:hypothetical protein
MIKNIFRKIFINRFEIPMKTLVFLAMFLVILSANLDWAMAESPPEPPSSYYGTVKIYGSNVAEGTLITAKMDGNVVASTEVLIDLGASVYAIKVPGEATIENDPVEFFIDGVKADQTGIWHSGGNTNLNLTIVGELNYHIFIPLIVY